MWETSCHRWPSEAAFLAACDAAGWSRGPDRKPVPGDGVVLDVIGPWIERPTLVDGVLEPCAFDPRWHVNVARLGVDVPASFLAATIAPSTPQRGFGLPAAAPPQPPPVPATVEAWKGKVVLREAGLLDAVEAAVAVAGGRVQDAWAGASEWSRDSEFLSDLAGALGLHADAVDKLFREADGIRG
jgi:hypothetical protein